MESSVRSARSSQDVARQSLLDQAIAQERSFDISISDEFAAKVDEQPQVPSLRQLAQEHWNAIDKKSLTQEAAQTTANLTQQTRPAPAAPAVGGSTGNLRSLLRTAQASLST